MSQQQLKTGHEGVLVTSDATTIVYLIQLNKGLPGYNSFILLALDAHNIFIKPEKMKFVQDQLALRMLDTTYDEDDLRDEI